jgi:hypothetical protein
MFSIKGFITTISLVLVLTFPSLSQAELIRLTGNAQLSDAGRKNILGGTFVTLFVARSVTKVIHFSKGVEVTYEPNLEISENAGSAIGEFLMAAGYDTVSYDELDVELLDEIFDNGGNFRKNGKLKTKVIREYINAAINAAKDAEIKYFGIGDIEIGLPQVDPVTGEMVLTAYVNFKVFDLSGKIVKSVATLKEKMVQVSGSDLFAMEMKVGNAAAIAAGNTVISQLQIKSIEKR